MIKIIFMSGLFFLASAQTQADAMNTVESDILVQQQIAEFAQMMATEHDFDAQKIVKQLNLLNKREDIIARISKPAESLPWYRYRKIFISDKRIDAGVEFWNQHAQILEKASHEFGVDPAIIVGILGIETFYGRIQGDYHVLEALYTLGFHYPKRAEFFRSELAQYYLLSREENWKLNSTKGSYAGAMGMGQFISSSYRHYGFDFNADGKVNLFSDPVDMIGSVANYFKRHGWRPDGFVIEPLTISEKQRDLVQQDLSLTRPIEDFNAVGVDTSRLTDRTSVAGLFAFDSAKNAEEYWLAGENFYVITRYNHSALYALAAFQLSQAVAEKREAQIKDIASNSSSKATKQTQQLKNGTQQHE